MADHKAYFINLQSEISETTIAKTKPKAFINRHSLANRPSEQSVSATTSEIFFHLFGCLCVHVGARVLIVFKTNLDENIQVLSFHSFPSKGGEKLLRNLPPFYPFDHISKNNELQIWAKSVKKFWLLKKKNSSRGLLFGDLLIKSTHSTTIYWTNIVGLTYKPFLSLITVINFSNIVHPILLSSC